MTSNSPTFPIDPVILEKYDVQEVLGRGGFSEVVKAIHKETGQICAIKIMSNPKDDPKYITELQSIENEINVLKVCVCVSTCKPRVFIGYRSC
jgi:serine/threonine protein kinase